MHTGSLPEGKTLVYLYQLQSGYQGAV